MITIITGLPGNGKTLYALTWLKEKAEKEGRQVYYNGIQELKIPGWIECVDPEQWMAIPTGSILIVDEAQRIFRPRMHGKEVPPYVAALETHRHLGVDLVFITQHPMLIESNVRRLCGQHFHIIRKFGTHFATIHEWGATKETCDKNRDDSVQIHWKYPEANFALYKSAEQHTHKRRIPFKVILLLSMPLILAALAWWAWQKINPHKEAEILNPATLTVAPGAVQSTTRSNVLSTPEYLAAHVPRVAGLAYTAPVYDQVTTVTEAPYPAACLSTEKAGCKCYSQQGTRLDVPLAVCADIVSRGFFLAWKPTYREPAGQVPERAQAPSEGRQAPPAPETAYPALAGGFEAPAPGRGRALPPPRPLVDHRAL